MIIDELSQRGLIQPPKFLPANTIYLTMMGSIVYGASNDASDRDVYGCVIPPKNVLFPHLDGHIEGFGRQKQRFDVWQQHHVKDERTNTEWDFSVYSIVKYFHLLMENNPNMLDSLFTPRNAVIHMTTTAQEIRDNRRLFIHKGCYHKFRGYAMSQMAKVRSKNKPSNEKRAKTVHEFGYDVKYAMHLVRLLLEVEQLLVSGDMDLARDSALYRKVRAGEWSLDYLEKWFAEKEVYLEELMNESNIPYEPDEGKIKDLLLRCLESHYGSLDAVIKVGVVKNESQLIQDLEAVLAKHKGS